MIMIIVVIVIITCSCYGSTTPAGASMITIISQRGILYYSTPREESFTILLPERNPLLFYSQRGDNNNDNNNNNNNDNHNKHNNIHNNDNSNDNDNNNDNMLMLRLRIGQLMWRWSLLTSLNFDVGLFP